ncbi:hypothetical protein K1T71_003220 [Dendrolimus kikuchii]|uniref:Uncharacterized protein n=1 Tax=Dendrolimus kikuchii TaxID=765133 RepID=A0ACC1DBC5_9NEOP|nr:hypothetical protein K1T71_003220 [Dendrolimus kikuchii]
MDDLNASLSQYASQLSMVNQALNTTTDVKERESLLTLQNDLEELIQLTQESLNAILSKPEMKSTASDKPGASKDDLDDEYALFMQEMAKTGAYDSNGKENKSESTGKDGSQNYGDSDIEDELATLLGMKCSVYHTHKWGGQPTLHNAMVSAIVPRQDDDQFKDLQVRVLFTHPTHTEMLPCPFYLDGECRFSDEQCRYSHGAVTHLSDLKEAIKPNFEALKSGSRVLLKLKPPDDEDISLTKKSAEKYHLWHRAVIKSIDLEEKTCVVKLEQGIKTGEKRKIGSDEYNVRIEDIYPLNNDDDDESDSSDSLSDTEYPINKAACTKAGNADSDLLVQKSLENNAPAMGEWERHTRGMGSKLMLAMGYVPGTGLGAASDGRVKPVEARLVPLGKSLDHVMAISEKNAVQDPLKIEQKLKRLQKREEERNKRAYEREKERERRNVFNFINRTLGDKSEQETSVAPAIPDVKQSTSKDLNIEQFKITEDIKRLERDIVKLKNSLMKYPSGSTGHKSVNMQIVEKNKELDKLLRREKQITKEQLHRKDKVKMTVF